MNIVMTGATSGIGLAAARRLIAESGASLIVGARTPERAPEDIRSKARALPLDLARLQSVRDFAAMLADEPAIDALILNAGLQTQHGQVSDDGFEMTFAVNHLAHYLLARLLVPRMASGGRIILTSSGTHDPDLKTGMPAPLHADAGKLAHPQTDPERDKNAGMAGRRAYSASKLCNVMTARSLATHLAGDRPDIMLAAFDPGFTPGTGLARDYPGPLNLIFRHVMPIFMRGERTSTPENSGRLLSELATEPRYQSARGGYFAVRGTQLVETPASKLAQDDAAGERLWRDSAAMVGLGQAGRSEEV
jgi:NAD(P)-dependent dehydrogenase (short-subunit alcohol dehydrogenase family)